MQQRPWFPEYGGRHPRPHGPGIMTRTSRLFQVGRSNVHESGGVLCRSLSHAGDFSTLAMRSRGFKEKGVVVETSIKSLSWKHPLLPAQRLDPARLCGLRGLGDRHWTSAGLKVGSYAGLSTQSPRSQPYLIRNDNILVILLGEDDTTCKLNDCSTNNLQKRIESLGFCPGWYLVPTVVPSSLLGTGLSQVMFSLNVFT